MSQHKQPDDFSDVPTEDLIEAITLFEAELARRKMIMLTAESTFGARMVGAHNKVVFAHYVLWQTISTIAATYHLAELLPSAWRVTILRAAYSGHDDIAPTTDILLDAAAELDKAVKDHGAFLDRHAPGSVDHTNIQKCLTMAGAVRDGILALLRENNPDDGTELCAALAAHSPNSYRLNQQWAMQLNELHDPLGPPTQYETSEAKRLVQGAMKEYHIQKGARGYRAQAKSGAIRLLFREHGAKDRDELNLQDQRVHDYLKTIDDSMISRWV